MKDKLKVLYLVNIPSPYRVSFFNELGKLCDLTVLFERKSSDEREASWHDYNFENFQGIFLEGIKFRKNQAISLGFMKYINDRSYDFIVIGGYATPTGALAINYSKIKKIPFLLNIDGGMIKEQENKLVKSIKKYYISSASAWLSTGKVGSNYLEYYGATKENIYVYPFTTLSKKDILAKPLNPLEKENLRKDLNMREGKVVISVGQFIHRKGFDVLIKAWSSVQNDASIYFLGGEPTDEYLELIKEKDVHNVYFMGFKSKYDLQKYYRAADLFVLPTREDIWGLVINEAMANGLPVITTNKCVAGLELVNNHENGFIVPVEDERALSERINVILENEEILRKMSENSLSRAEKYTVENMASETIRIFYSLKKVSCYDE